MHCRRTRHAARKLWPCCSAEEYWETPNRCQYSGGFFEQPSTSGPVAVDLATSIPTDVRRAVEEEALAEYVRKLRDGNVTDYGLSELRRDLVLASLRLWAGMVTGYGASLSETFEPCQQLLQRIEIDRMRDTVADWHLTAVLTTL